MVPTEYDPDRTWSQQYTVAAVFTCRTYLFFFCFVLFFENFLSLSLLRCGPHNNRTKEKRKQLKLKKKQFEKQNKILKIFLSLTFFYSNIFCLTFHLWASFMAYSTTGHATMQASWSFLPSDPVTRLALLGDICSRNCNSLRHLQKKFANY